MSASLNLTSAAAFRDYVEDMGDQLIAQGFYGFKTADYMTVHEGVKGKKILTSLMVNDLARRWAKQFNAPLDTIVFAPRELNVEFAKVELEIYPQDFESTYLGKKRKKGQGMDIPFEGDIMMQVMKKLAQELDIATIQGVKAATPASTDLLKQLYHGLLKLITDLIAAGHAPYVVAGGALTTANIMTVVRDMQDGIGEAYKEGDLEIYMSLVNMNKYFDAHVTKYQGIKPQVRFVNGVKQTRTEDESGWIIGLPSWKNSNRICVTPPGNFHLGYDDIVDWQSFNFKDDIRSIKFWMDFKMGVQIFLAEESAFMVNNLA